MTPTTEADRITPPTDRTAAIQMHSRITSTDRTVTMLPTGRTAVIQMHSRITSTDRMGTMIPMDRIPTITLLISTAT